MTGLLTFFAAPARLKGLVIAAGIMLLVALALTTWALLERTARLSCKVDVVELRGEVARLNGQIDVLADKIATQNEAIEAWKAAADARKAFALAAGAAAEKVAQGLQPELERLGAKIAEQAAAGAAKSCAEAAAEVRKGLRP